MLEIKKLKSELSTARRIVLFGHQNPDGDAIGSTLGLKCILDKLGHNAIVMVPNEFPKFLKWLPNAKDVFIADFSHTAAEKIVSNADLHFLLDFNSLSRISFLAPMVENHRVPRLLIDHHQQPETFDYMYSYPNEPATCLLVYNFIVEMGWEDLIDEQVATCLYTGILTDTGNFRFRNTTPNTLLVASKLLSYGVDLAKLQTRLFDSQSFDRLRLLGKTIERMEYMPEKRTAILSLTREEMKAHNFTKGDTEGFVNYGLGIHNNVFVAFFKEDLHKDFIKISFRSKGDFDVNTFARKHFNGGGHVNAAGGRSDVSLNETLDKFKALLEDYAPELQACEI